ncbi:hypothetical protein [Pseudomonas sp. 22 E 5]|uniref:hypothetical protein n=1 Tax=Pseudomonas TaxID=286 RepID=UPI000811ED4B|nr:hypothetical protein [Pseudomonas sp. 2995-1]PIB54057.1 hypothetical protein AOA61_22295 [Pseudomonas sp. 2995-1]CRM94485.1 hypothetical protein [Pseudomonas sp. 22 E 5]
MLARFITGLLIGFVAGIIEAFGPSMSKKWQNISELLIVLVGLAFIASSFAFGMIFGFMAIAEITAGFYAYGKVFRTKKTSRSLSQ